MDSIKNTEKIANKVRQLVELELTKLMSKPVYVYYLPLCHLFTLILILLIRVVTNLLYIIARITHISSFFISYFYKHVAFNFYGGIYSTSDSDLLTQNKICRNLETKIFLFSVLEYKIKKIIYFLCFEG